MKEHHPHRDRPLAVMAFLGSALLAAFWALYLAGAITLGEPGSAVAAFESAFPAADALAAGLPGRRRGGALAGPPAGRMVMTAGASMVLYLGVLDLTFYSRQGFFRPARGRVVARAGAHRRLPGRRGLRPRPLPAAGEDVMNRRASLALRFGQEWGRKSVTRRRPRRS